MQCIVRLLLVAGCVGRVSLALAEVEPALPNPRMIAMEVVIAELGPGAADAAAVMTGPAESVLAAVRELEEQGKLESLTRVRLTSLEQQQARVQFGERRPIVTARSRFAGRARDDGSSSSTYEMQNVGTVVTMTGRVEDDGSVITELAIEKSRLVSSPASGQPQGPPDDVPQPPRVSTMMVQSTVRIPPGQAVAVGGIESRSTSDGESGQVTILVMARVSEFAVDRPDDAAATPLRVFALRNAKTKTAAEALASVFVDDVMHIAVDERTNSVLVRAPRGRYAEIEAILQRLDEAR